MNVQGSASTPSPEERAQIKRLLRHADRASSYLRMLRFWPSNLSSPDAYLFTGEALHNDMVSKLCLILDESKQAYSFWKIYNTCSSAGVDGVIFTEIEWLKELSERLRKVRDKVHFHLDREFALDWRQAWQQAALTANEAKRALELVDGALRQLLAERYGEHVSPNAYTGDDFRRWVMLGCDHGILPHEFPDQWRDPT